jgi:hypothetical protein
MRNFLIITLCFLSTLVQGQQYDCFLDYNKETIIENFNLLCKNNQKYLSSIKDSAGRLKVELSGYEKISCEFRFDSLGYCDRSQFIYACDECAEKHIRDFEQDHYYRWRLKAPGMYNSKRKRKMTMEIFNSNPAATVIIFTKTNWTRKEYKALVSTK